MTTQDLSLAGAVVPAVPTDAKRTAVTTQLLGVGLLVVGAVLLYLLITVWPTVTVAMDPNTDAGKATPLTLFGVFHIDVIPDSALLLLVVVSSALGSYVHAATSFATFVGNRALGLSWVWWYLLRLFIGVALATIFYLAVRGGFLAAQADTRDVNPHGMAALAGLVGLFSKQATDKLEEVFSTLFRVQERKGDALRKDKIEVPRPRLVAVEPQTVPRRATASISLRGDGFVPESAVRVTRLGGGEVMTDQTVTGGTTIDLVIEGRHLDEPGQLQLTVINPAPGGGPSNPMLLPIEDIDSPRRRFSARRRG
jgi:hypothetical protein